MGSLAIFALNHFDLGQIASYEIKYLVFSSLIGLLSIFAIRLSINRLRFLTGVNGLNVMVLVFLGLGPLCYYFTNEGLGYVLDRRSTIYYYSEVSVYFFIGYLISIIIDYFTPVYKQSGKSFTQVSSKQLVRAIFVLFSFAIIGYIFTEKSISTTGTGTIFPVFRKFLYPTVVLSIYNMNLKRPVSVLLSLIVCLVGFYFAFTSWWRSELLLISGAVAIGFLMKSRKAALPLTVAGILGVFYILPFQQVKKIEYDKVKGSLGKTFIQTLNTSFEERVIFSSLFFAERINYGREIAFVQHAIDKKWVHMRYGESYQEVLLQLVPRAIWPDKPSFNTYVNVYLAKRMGLIGEENDHTAWGVNLFAEFILNFPFEWLIVFVPFSIYIIRAIDRFILRLYRNPIIVFVTLTAFFFIIFQMVSSLVVSTYILWMLITAKMFEVFLTFKVTRNSSVFEVSGK